MLSEAAFFAWEMWNTLHQHRQINMGANPIPFSEAVGYLDFYCTDYTVDDKHDMLQLFKAIEDAWLTDARKKEKNDSVGGGATYLPTKK